MHAAIRGLAVVSRTEFFKVALLKVLLYLLFSFGSMYQYLNGAILARKYFIKTPAK